MRNLVLLGRPGSGKGTLAVQLSKQLNIPHISTGDIFRDHMARKTELGLSILDSMNAGQYVDDETTNTIIKERLAEPDAQAGFILDGYPRTVPQAQFLETEGLQVDFAVNISVPEQVCITRLLNRAQQQQRGDDTETVILDRMKLYEDTVTPVVAFYSSKGNLLEINGESSPENVLEELLKRLP